MAEIGFAKLATHQVLHQNKTSSSDLDLNPALSGAVKDMFNLLLSLDSLQSIIDQFAGLSEVDMQTLTSEEHANIQRWAEVKHMLTERKLVTTLLFQHSQNAEDQMRRLDILQGAIRDTMVHCKRRGKQCSEKFVRKILGINNLNCYMYDFLEGDMLQESTIQGISNGVTFVFMTGSGILATEYTKRYKWLIPGFRNTFHTSAGSDGIRLMIHDPELSPMPEIDGIDIAPGMDTTIGVTSQEYIRLPYPYGACSTDNIETDRFLESVKRTRGFTPDEGAGMVKTRYNAATCRGTCLLRHIWERCDCMLMSGSLPFMNTSLLCGYSDNDVLYNPQKLSKQMCFLSEHKESILKQTCDPSIRKLFQDLKCVQDVLAAPTDTPQSSGEDAVNCDCPMACHFRSYDTSIGTSKWPSLGPELDAAYETIVMDKVIPYLKQLNSTLTQKPIQYLSKRDNKAEIMQNFARVTIYIKNLKVDRIEQVAAYTALDLVSDIGEWIICERV